MGMRLTSTCLPSIAKAGKKGRRRFALSAPAHISSSSVALPKGNMDRKLRYIRNEDYEMRFEKQIYCLCHKQLNAMN